MIAEQPRNSKSKAKLSNVSILSLAPDHTISANIEALKFYTGLNDTEVSEGLTLLPFMAYSSHSRDIALSVQSDLENFGFECKLK